MKKSILLIFTFIITGCGGYSFHGKYKCIIVANVIENMKPAAEYPIHISYPYDHYGIFYIWNAPKTEAYKLNEKGQVAIEIADFYRPFLVVGSSAFMLNNDIIINGGKPYKFPYEHDDSRYQKKREFSKYLPARRYPDVEVKIFKSTE